MSLLLDEATLLLLACHRLDQPLPPRPHEVEFVLPRMRLLLMGRDASRPA